HRGVQQAYCRQSGVSALLWIQGPRALASGKSGRLRSRFGHEHEEERAFRTGRGIRWWISEGEVEGCVHRLDRGAEKRVGKGVRLTLRDRPLLCADGRP